MNRREIIEALKADDFTEFYREADRICRREKGDTVFMRAIIEYSNRCGRLCAYCGINAAADIRRYTMKKSEIIDTALAAAAAGYRTIVLQGGENLNTDVEELGQVISVIKRAGDGDGDGIAVTLSCGELPEEDLKYLWEMGADRYLLKHETADPELYSRLHPDSSLAERVECLRRIKDLGYEAGSGFMVGLPGATVETTADDLLLLKELQCDMAGIGPFIPSPDTPLAGAPPGDTEMTKRAVAIARMLLPKANLPVTTSLGVLDEEERRKAFSCGANVIMKKVTPNKYKDMYKIYPADIPEIHIKEDRNNIIEMLEGIGKKGV